MANSTISLYGQTFQQILDKVLGGAKKDFQLVYPFMDWTWPVPPAGFIDAKCYTVVGQMPSYSAIGNASYSPGASTLYGAYKNMLLRCPRLTESADHRQQLIEAQNQINRAQTEYQNQDSAMKTAWRMAMSDIPEGMPAPEFTEWEVKSGWAQTMEAAQAAVDKASQTKLSIVAQQNPAYKKAVKACELPESVNQMPMKDGFRLCQIAGQKQMRPNYLVSNGEDWMAQLTRGGGNSVTIELDASTKSYALKESWAGGTASYGNCFFSIYARGSWHDMKLNEEDKSVKVTITIQAVTQVPVHPDVWFDGGYLRTLAREDSWNNPFTNETVFGKEGILPLMITGLVAGYKIGFKITMSSSTFQRHVNDFKVSGGLRIGPFHIGGGGYQSHTDSWSKSTEGQSFSGESNAEYPFIIGFTVAKPGGL